MEIEIERNLKVNIAKWVFPNKLFSGDQGVKRNQMIEEELVKEFDFIWDNHLKDAAKKASVCLPDNAKKELSAKQKNYLDKNQEHREIFLEGRRLKFIIQLQELSEEKFKLTQLWYINYPDQHPTTLYINFDSIEEREKFKTIAEKLKWNDEKLGKELILDFMAKFNNQLFE